jgi:hypothetical protein
MDEPGPFIQTLDAAEAWEPARAHAEFGRRYERLDALRNG